jgi:hypothetical protein
MLFAGPQAGSSLLYFRACEEDLLEGFYELVSNFIEASKK